jgi:hypothetical protein
MHRLVSIALALVAVASPLRAQGHPDFSGKWVLDPKSVDGGMGPTSMTLDVVQDAKAIKVESAATSPMGDQKSSQSFNLDGSPSKNAVNTPAGSLDLTSTGVWDGDAFVVTTKGEMQGQTLTFTERWTLDAGGKILRLQRDISAGGQSFNLKLAFNKQ